MNHSATFRASSGSPRIAAPLTAAQFQELVARVKSGDADACIPLVAAFAPALRSQVCRQMNWSLKARLEPDDIMQEVWLELFRNLRKFEGSDPLSFLRWMNLIVGWKIKDSRKYHFHTARRQAPGILSLDESDGGFGVSKLRAPVLPPDGGAIASEDARLLRRLLGLLTRAQRTAIASVASGLTVSQVALRMGISSTTVNVHIHRGRRRLRQIVSA